MNNKLISSISELTISEYRTRVQSHNDENLFKVKDCDIDFEIDFKNDVFSTVNFDSCNFLKKVNFIDAVFNS